MIYGNAAFTDISFASFMARTEEQREATEAFDGPSLYEVEQVRFWVGEPVRLVEQDLMVEDSWLAGPFKTKEEAQAARSENLSAHPHARIWISRFTPVPGMDAFCRSEVI